MESDPSLSESSLTKSDFSDDSNYSKSRRENALQRKSVKNTRNRTRHTHRQTILIRLTKMTIDARVAKKVTQKVILSNYARG